MPNPDWPKGGDVLPVAELILALLFVALVCKEANGDEFRLWFPKAPPLAVDVPNELVGLFSSPPPKGFTCRLKGLFGTEFEFEEELKVPKMPPEVVEFAGESRLEGGIKGLGLELGF